MSKTAKEEAPVLWLQKVERRYSEAGAPLEILKGADFAIWPGETVALIAPSGTGKSTLLHVAGLLEAPDGGEVYVGGEATSALSDKERTRIRRLEIGFVYQFHHLLPEFSALDNVAMPLRIRRLPYAECTRQAEAMLAHVGLAGRVQHRPAELSGGERQRVAIARALVTKPACVLADEPTGNLDRTTAEGVFQHMLQLAREQGTAFVMVTHDETLAARCDRVLRLVAGRLQEAAD